MKNRYDRYAAFAPVMFSLRLLVLLAVMLFTSCRPPLGNLKPRADGPETAELEISFSSVPVFSGTGDLSRTIVPASDLGIDSITVTVRRGAAVLGSAAVGSASTTCVISGLTPGAVTVTAEAYAGGTIVAEGETEEPLTLTADEVKAVRIALLPAADAGTGTIRLALSWPASTGAGYVECSLDGGTAAGGAGAEVEPGTMGYTYEKEEASAGAHELSIAFFDNNTDRNLLGAFVEAVNVYAGLTSDHWLDGEGGSLPVRAFGAEEFKASLVSLKSLTVTGAGISEAYADAELNPPGIIAMGNVAASAVRFTATLTATEDGQRIGYTWNGLPATPIDIDSGVSSSELTLVDGAGGNTLVITVTASSGYASTYTLTVRKGNRLSYDGNGATGGDVPEEELHYQGEPVTVTSNAGELSLAGHALMEWNTSSGGTGASYHTGEAFPMGNTDATLYAIWIPGEMATGVTGYQSGGNWVIADGSVASGALEIPGYWNGLPVVIANSAFYNNVNVTSIAISDGVTSIGDFAFYSCSGLTEVTVQRTSPPDAGTTIFQNCTALTAIHVPAGSVDTYKTWPGWDTYAALIVSP